MFCKTETVALKIEGMMCNNCKRHVEEALKAVKGVKKIDVSLENGEAAVEFQAGKTDGEALAAAVTAAGYKASVK